MKRLKWKEIGLLVSFLGMVSKVQGVEGSGRIYGEPTGSTALDTLHTIDSVVLIMNNTEDRVGARAKLCQTLSDSPCERMVFNFPQLHLDKEKNLILMGDKPVAHLQRHGMRVTVDPDYHLGYDIVSHNVDSGFDKSKGRQLRIYLEPKTPM